MEIAENIASSMIIELDFIQFDYIHWVELGVPQADSNTGP